MAKRGQFRLPKMKLPVPGKPNGKRNKRVPAQRVGPMPTPRQPIDQLHPHTFVSHFVQYDLLQRGL